MRVLWKRKLRPRSRLQRVRVSSSFLLSLSFRFFFLSLLLLLLCCLRCKPNTHLDHQRCRPRPRQTGSFRNKSVLTKQSKNTYIHKFELKFNHGYLQRHRHKRATLVVGKIHNRKKVRAWSPWSHDQTNTW